MTKSTAFVVAVLVSGWCTAKWGAATDMHSTMVESFIDAFKGYRGGGSHKHIAELNEINARLNLSNGTGVFWYHAFDDGSRLFLTCEGPLAVLDGEGLRWVNGESR